MGVLDPSPFIDDPVPNPMGSAPMQAAQGQLGGLQRALVRRPLAQGVNPLAYESPEEMIEQLREMQLQSGGLSMPGIAGTPETGVGSPEMAEMMERAIASRIRSPEQMNEAEATRRGALEQLVGAMRSPVDGDSTFDSYYNEAQMQMPGSQNFGPAIGKAMGMVRERNQAQRESEIKALGEILKFEGGEEKNADSAERTAMSDAARLLAKKRAGLGVNGSPFKFTKDGVFRVDVIDPATGGPTLVRPATKDYTRAYETAYRQATQLAMDPSMEGVFPSVEHRDAWIAKTAQVRLKNIMEGVSNLGAGNAATVAAPAAQENSAAGKAPVELKPTGVDMNVAREGARWAESNGNKYAINPESGAGGSLQVMPATNKDPGFGVTPAKDDSVEERERVGNEYFQAMYDRYNGNLPVVYAAHNWGPGNVDKWLKDGADPRKLPKETRQYIGDIMTHMQVQGMSQPAAAAAAQTPAPAPAAAPLAPVAPVAQAPAAIQGSQLKTEAERKREKEFATNDEKAAAEVLGTWRNQGNQAESALNTVSNIRALRDRFEPGKFAEVRSELGAYLDAIGFKTKLGDEAKNIQTVSKMLQQEVNDRMTLEKGVQTEGDTQRFTKAYAAVKDTPGAFDFTLGMIKEQALRKQMRVEFAEQYMKQNGTMAGMQTAWKKHNESVGPMLTPDVGGRPMWRHDWVDETVSKTLAAHPDADELDVRQRAEKDWFRRYGRAK